LSVTDVVNDLIAPLLVFFNTLMGSIVLLGLMVIFLLVCLALLKRSRRKAGAQKKPPVMTDGSSTDDLTKDIPAITPSNVDIVGIAGAGEVGAVGADDADNDLVEDDDRPKFTFFRRKKKSPSTETPPNSDAAENGAGKPETSSYDEELKVLHDVEQEMLATRQLYINGHISKDVYVAETRALYERVQNAE
jgi:hypothetical protein